MCGFRKRLFGSVVILLLAPCKGARILAFFPIPSKSHHFFAQPILLELGRLGHQVDYYSPIDMRSSHPNVTRIPVEDFSNTFLGLIGNISEKWFGFLLAKNEREMIHWASISLQLNEKLGQSFEVQKLLKSSVKYDLLLHEGLLVFSVGHVFAHKFNVPSVNVLPIRDAFHVNYFSGLVTNPAFMVDSMSPFTDRMGFWNRLENTFSCFASLVMMFPYLSRIQAIADKHFTYPGWETRPNIFRLMSDQALILANGHHSVGYSYPRPPHFVEIGGAVLLPRQPLQKDLDDFIDDAKDGVIYFSLGTIVDIAGNDLKYTFASVFSQRKERVLWKWNDKPLPNASKNIKFSKFFPQQDILAHKKIKLFITHSGLQSSFEAVHFAVPVLMIPFFADQTKNARCLAQSGYGLMLERENLTVDSLGWAIDEIVKNPKYKASVERGSAALRDRPMSPIREAGYWIEYVLRHGKVLQPVGAQMSTLELYCLDVIAFVLIVVALVIYLTNRILTFLKSCLVAGKKSKYKKN